MNYNLKTPCKECPFRNDKPHLKGWLGKARATEIANSITHEQKTFQCHKTLNLPEDKQEHCSGAMILLEHMERPNQMMRIMERIGFYDRTKLNMESPVFKNTKEFIQSHT